MNIRTKSSILMLVTLCIGFVLGVLVDRTIVQRQIRKKFEMMRSKQAVAHMIERIIDPSEAQYPKVKIILDRYAERFQKLGEHSRKEMFAVMDSMHTELESVLTDKQKMKLQQRMERMKRKGPMRFKGDRPRGRHGERRPDGPPEHRNGEHEPPPPPF